MRIRLADPSDLDAIVDITLRAYASYRPILGGDPVPVTEDYAPRIAGGQVWLLEVDATPAALLVLEDHADRLHIFSVAVDPAHQHRGIGRHLLTFAEETALQRGFAILDLCTHEKMERNIRLYREWGFSEVRRRPNPRREGWILVDMEKQLAAAGSKQRAIG